MLNHPEYLLTTLAQSSAAVVAIVGGFLVSRLVSLSSEREGLRRQLISARDHLCHVRDDYEEAHSYRFSNSRDTFNSWTIEGVAAWNDQSDFEQLLLDNIPRGSSEAEMRPVLEEFVAAAQQVQRTVRSYLITSDNDRLKLSDLQSRGLQVPREQEDLYNYVVDHIAETELPEHRQPPYGALAGSALLRPSSLVALGDQATSSRRLDESIREEQDLRARKLVLEADESRLKQEIQRIGNPMGVTSAIVILGIYSLSGIVMPVLVLALGPTQLRAWFVWLLLLLFVVGLFAVLGYILWYSRTLNKSVH